MKSNGFALIVGIAYLAAGLLGLVPAMLMPPPADAPATHFTMMYGYLMGLFPVNILHTGVHLAIGAWGLAAWSGRTSSMTFARALAVIYGALAVMGMLPVLNTTFGMIPIHGHDIWLHGVTALAAAYVGWREPASRSEDERRLLMHDRRQSMIPVRRERRFGLADRRERWGGMTPA
ncbi:MAG TPA: DUF4383 domain-containing protein [Burkholderiales bacterium]